MLNTIESMSEAFVVELRDGYRRTWGELQPEYPNIIAWVASSALEIISRSDALYHNVEHTILVTLVGQELLRGQHIKQGGVAPRDWLQVMVALLCHDIGYVRGVCRRDRGLVCATGKADETVTLKPGATDASLTPYHVDRGQLFIEERFGRNAQIEVEAVKRYIQCTRFPVPADEDPREVAGYPSLVRAADLIGQLSDPRYLVKIPALFYEFEETGVNKALGYKHPGDLRHNYARFYWNCVYPYIGDSLVFLSQTQRGLQVRANLFSNVFMVEHEDDFGTE
ncbi:MAG: metal-dependent phosphohydrolase [Acidobacteria bacterium]|nr:metal-dependent phosphohydrolase [Acidobacteriota bacterium]MCG3191074.1 hypothetical protein [Thermoanaerobaculia bacterium]MCK6683343.1 metal-dependent phosphohydrolase [Thermoanaerobaculia bacterium]